MSRTTSSSRGGRRPKPRSFTTMTDWAASIVVIPLVLANGEFVTGDAALFDCFAGALTALVGLCSVHELSRSTTMIAITAEIKAVIHHRSGGMFRSGGGRRVSLDLGMA